MGQGPLQEMSELVHSELQGRWGHIAEGHGVWAILRPGRSVPAQPGVGHRPRCVGPQLGPCFQF